MFGENNYLNLLKSNSWCFVSNFFHSGRIKTHLFRLCVSKYNSKLNINIFGEFIKTISKFFHEGTCLELDK